MPMDVVDYEIFGDDMQYVEIELDPGEAAIGEAGAMMMMQDGIEMDTIFGDGSAQQGGLFGKLLGAGKRLVTGESLFTTIFHNESHRQAPRRVRRALPRQDHSGEAHRRRRHADLPEGQLPVRRARRVAGHRLPAAAGRRPVRRRRLHHAEARRRWHGVRACRRHADDARPARRANGCASIRAASSRFQQSVDFDIQYVGKLKSALFSGEGLFFATLTGPGRVWLQSLPLSRLANRIIASAPRRGRPRARRGSLLGGLGGLLDGDNN